MKQLAKSLVGVEIDCGSYKLVCRWERVKVRFKRVRVFDRLSGLEIEVLKPLIIFEKGNERCVVEVVWRGDGYLLDCRLLEKCCEKL